MTWRQVAAHARALAAGLDALGVGRGERVAIVSQNSARLFVALFGVPGYGRVVVPINFRLNAEEIGYIVEHSGATVLLIDPELEEALATVEAKHKFVLGRPATRCSSGSIASPNRGSTSETRSPPSTTRVARPPARRASS